MEHKKDTNTFDKFEKQWEELAQHSVAELEAMAIEFVAKIRKGSWKKSWEDDLQLKNILSVRHQKLNDEFVFTPENIEKILRINQKLMEGMEKLRKEEEAIICNFEERMKNNDSFLNDYEIEAQIMPFIMEQDENGQNMGEPDKGIYCLLHTLFPDDCCLHFDPRWDDTYFDKKQNCNRIMAKNGELDDYFISLALCDFHDYTQWSWQDIIKINELWCEVKVTHQHFVEKI
ncbi:MAG: hypothetical protein LBO74_08755 [Candidatus Symbiothrix sp.]|jgi:hypothetical protein|nr:hypothetical protein [Candidatus Symbiothrix sp.]